MKKATPRRTAILDPGHLDPAQGAPRGSRRGTALWTNRCRRNHDLLGITRYTTLTNPCRGLQSMGPCDRFCHETPVRGYTVPQTGYDESWPGQTTPLQRHGKEAEPAHEAAQRT